MMMPSQIVDPRGRRLRRQPRVECVGINISVGLARSSGASSGSVASVTGLSSVSQWDGATTGQLQGTGFPASPVVLVDGSASGVTVTGSTSTTIDFTIASSDPGPSPLQTSGTKTVTVSGCSGSATFTVTSFTYTTPSGCRLLLDPDPANLSFGTGSAVSQWNDTSGIGKHVPQATASKQPLSVSSLAALNNRPAIRFDGVDDFMRSAWNWNTVFTAAEFTKVAVFVPNAISTNAATVYSNVMVCGDNSGNANLCLKSGGPTAHPYMFDSAARSTSHSITLGAGQIIGARHNVATFFGRSKVGGETSVGGSGGVVSTTTFLLGSDYSLLFPFDGWVGHIIGYDNSISAANYDRVMRKLKVFYAL